MCVWDGVADRVGCLLFLQAGQILAAASLHITSNPFSQDPSRSLDLFAGQPIHAILSIHTSFHWSPIEDSDTRSYAMRFDVEEMSKDWLVSGRKRGDFTATVGLFRIR